LRARGARRKQTTTCKWGEIFSKKRGLDITYEIGFGGLKKHMAALKEWGIGKKTENNGFD